MENLLDEEDDTVQMLMERMKELLNSGKMWTIREIIVVVMVLGKWMGFMKVDGRLKVEWEQEEVILRLIQCLHQSCLVHQRYQCSQTSHHPKLNRSLPQQPTNYQPIPYHVVEVPIQIHVAVQQSLQAESSVNEGSPSLDEFSRFRVEQTSITEQADSIFHNINHIYNHICQQAPEKTSIPLQKGPAFRRKCQYDLGVFCVVVEGQNGKNDSLEGSKSGGEPLVLELSKDGSSNSSFDREAFPCHTIIQKPIRSSSVDISEYCDLKEKLEMLDDQRNSLMSSLQYSNTQTNTLMEKVVFQKSYIEYLENWKESAEQKYQQRLEAKNQTIDELKSQVSKSIEIIELLDKETIELKKREDFLKNQNFQMENCIEQLKYRLKALTIEMEKKEVLFNEKLEERQMEIDELLKQFREQKSFMFQDMEGLNDSHCELKQQIENKEVQLEQKTWQLAKIQYAYHKLMQNFAEFTEQSLPIQSTRFYEEELQKLKGNYAENLENQEKANTKMVQRSKQLEQQLLINQNSVNLQKKLINNYQQEIESLKKDSDDKKKVIQRLKEDQLREKDLEIDILRKRLSDLMDKIKDKSEQINCSNEQISELNPQYPSSKEDNLEEIKRIMWEYENVIKSQFDEIKFLQFDVVEYLQLAMEKEKQVQEAQADLYSLLATNKNLENENKNCRRIIRMMERRTNSNKKLRIHTINSDDEEPFESKDSSTIKFNY